MTFKNLNNKNIIFFISLIFGLFLYSDFASAAATYNSLVTIPGMRANPNVFEYLGGLYTFLVSVVGLVAMGAIVIGGARYLTSAGNPSAIEDAKHTIYQAFYGLLLALTSWVIIREINPDILVLKKPGVSLSTSVYGYGSKTSQCALPGGDGKTQAPPSAPDATACPCVDGQKVLAINPIPPYVVSTSPTPCETGVSILLPYRITITFSDPMDPVSVGWSIFPPVISTSSISADNKMAITDLTAPLAPNTEYTVTVAGTSKRLSDGVTLPANYVFNFTTGAAFATPCTPSPTGSGCNRFCSDPSLASDGLNHCDSKFVRIKMNTYAWLGSDYGTWDDPIKSPRYFHLDNRAELYEFFTLYKLKYDDMDFRTTPLPITYGGNEYNCGLYISERFSTVADNAAVVWVRPGIEINSDGNSLKYDIEKSAYDRGIPNPWMGCAIDRNSCNNPGDETGHISDIKNIWYSHYTDSPILKDNCGDCSLSASNTQYRPNKSLICDPNAKKWQYK